MGRVIWSTRIKSRRQKHKEHAFIEHALIAPHVIEDCREVTRTVQDADDHDVVGIDAIKIQMVLKTQFGSFSNVIQSCARETIDRPWPGCFQNQLIGGRHCIVKSQALLHVVSSDICRQFVDIRICRR
jgi:hypothetical protein